MKRIIAEAGCCWRYLTDLHEIFRRASVCEVDAVKLQLYDKKVIAQAPEKWRTHLRQTMIDLRRAKAIKEIADSYGVNLFFTPMFLQAVEWCEELDVTMYKVRSVDAYNDQLLLAIRETEKPCYVSRNNIDTLDPIKQYNFYTVFYDKNRPTKYKDVFAGYSNLIRSDGYSSHCEKLYAVLQVMLFGGVNYIEVHVTLDTKDKGLPDWQYSFPFSDVFEMCEFRDFLNKRHNEPIKLGEYEIRKEKPSKWQIT